MAIYNSFTQQTVSLPEGKPRSQVSWGPHPFLGIVHEKPRSIIPCQGEILHPRTGRAFGPCHGSPMKAWLGAKGTVKKWLGKGQYGWRWFMQIWLDMTRYDMIRGLRYSPNNDSSMIGNYTSLGQLGHVGSQQTCVDFPASMQPGMLYPRFPYNVAYGNRFLHKTMQKTADPHFWSAKLYPRTRIAYKLVLHQTSDVAVLQIPSSYLTQPWKITMFDR